MTQPLTNRIQTFTHGALNAYAGFAILHGADDASPACPGLLVNLAHQGGCYFCPNASVAAILAALNADDGLAGALLDVTMNTDPIVAGAAFDVIVDSDAHIQRLWQPENPVRHELIRNTTAPLAF